MIGKILSGMSFFFSEQKRKYGIKPKTQIFIWATILFQISFGFAYIYFYEWIVALPHYVKCITMATGSYFYFFGEGTTEGYTFVSDHIACHRDFRPGWSISHRADFIYHYFRGWEAIGISLFLSSGLAARPQSEYELLAILVCAVWAYPFYQKRLAMKFKLGGDEK